MEKSKSPETIAAANGIGVDTAFGAVSPPLYLSTSYAFQGFGQPREYDYSRAGNPTRDLLADTLAKLEGGAGAVLVASGMAAIDLVLARCGPGDLIIAPHDCYGGTHKLLRIRAAKRQFNVVFVDQNETCAVREVLDGKPKLLLIETPSNPLLRIVDIRELASKAKAAGAEIAVDNTFMSPALQRPIALGADFVIHSTTKYLNGHSDVIGGAVVGASQTHVDELSEWANATGVIGSPFDAYLTLRGLRTLFPRMERQQQSAAAVAAFLQSQPKVAAVYYPGLPTHPGHDTARAQQRGFGAMLSFEIAGGPNSVRSFVEALRVITLADSLGGVESLIAHPATMTHVSMGPEARSAAGIKDNLLRLSIGLESERDLLADLEFAFASVVA